MTFKPRELNTRIPEKMMNDLNGMEEHLPKTLNDALLAIPEEHRAAVRKLQLLSIQWGRSLESADWEKAFAESRKVATPSKEPSKILIVPGEHLPRKIQ